MYNEAFKNQYIEDNTDYREGKKLLPMMFNTIEMYEERYEKDLCNFTLPEIQNYFNGLATSSIARCLNIRSQFIKYSQYCQERGLIKDNQIHWQEVDRQFLNKCINVGKLDLEHVTREELLKMLGKLPNPSDKFVILGIFEGICDHGYHDFHHMSMIQFNKTKDGIWLNLTRGALSVSQQLYDFALESSETFVRYTENSSDGRKVYNPNDSYVVKVKANAKEDTFYSWMRMISNMLTKVKKDMDAPYVTQSALTNSGRLDYIKQNLKEGEDVREYIVKNREQLEYRHGVIQNVSDLVEQYNNYYGN